MGGLRVAVFIRQRRRFIGVGCYDLFGEGSLLHTFGLFGHTKCNFGESAVREWRLLGITIVGGRRKDFINEQLAMNN